MDLLVTLMAFGSSKSGKTHSIFGTKDNKTQGLLHLTLETIYAYIAEVRNWGYGSANTMNTW